jgi:UDP-GlcNAc:undecaprenyl-phosphate GlcNAc-1-phosphate transferase
MTVLSSLEPTQAAAALLLPGLRELIACFLGAALISLSGTLAIIRTPGKTGMDAPDGRRKRHEKPVSRLGGGPIFLALMVGALVLLWLGFFDLHSLLPVLVSCALMFAVGFIDDLRPLGARVKLLGQVAVSLVLYGMGVSIEVLSNPFGEGGLQLGWWSLPLTVFWLVAIPNIINLIDGMDGLAGGFGMFLTLTLAIVGYLGGNSEVMLLSVLMAGGLAGFLFFNLPPARIFLGDGGAYLLGFFIAATSLRSSQKGSVIAALLVIIIALGVPILDTFFAILRRAIRGVPIFTADAEHIHHRLILLGYSKGRALLAMYSVCLVLSLVGISILLTKGGALPVAGAVLFLLAVGAARYLGYVKSWTRLREQVRTALVRRRRLEHIRAHARALEFDIEQCETLNDFAELLQDRFRWVGFQPNAGPDKRLLHLPVGPDLEVTLHCPADDLLESEWLIRADAFATLFERCLERWGSLPAFLLPVQKTVVTPPVNSAETSPGRCP